MTASRILFEVGYKDTCIEKVKMLILKKNFPDDPDACTLEDALCLTFLEFQLDDFLKKTEDDKALNAIRKSWAKMTERARSEALQIKFSADAGMSLELDFKAGDLINGRHSPVNYFTTGTIVQKALSS